MVCELIWILRIYVTDPFLFLVIDEVRVENHHGNEIKALTHFMLSLHESFGVGSLRDDERFQFNELKIIFSLVKLSTSL